MRKRHPAFDLFEKMFNEAAANPGPTLPTYFVTRNIFHKKCAELGILPTERIGFIESVKWEEEIGLPEFAHRIIARYHRSKGTDFTPGEKATWRLRKKLNKTEF